MTPSPFRDRWWLHLKEETNMPQWTGKRMFEQVLKLKSQFHVQFCRLYCRWCNSTISHAWGYYPVLRLLEELSNARRIISAGTLRVELIDALEHACQVFKLISIMGDRMDQTLFTLPCGAKDPRSVLTLSLVSVARVRIGQGMGYQREVRLFRWITPLPIGSKTRRRL